MKVEEICTRNVRSCTKATTLAEAGNLMWEADCGFLPILDESGKVVGVVTDRDVCMALAVIGEAAAHAPVQVQVRPVVHTCRMGDGVREALRTMRVQKVRRLPVVDGAGVLQGIVSLSDVALAAKPERLAGPADVTDEDVVLALKAICKRVPVDPRVPDPAVTAFV